MTASSANSYCDFKVSKKAFIKPANVYICHAWKFNFLNVVSILDHHFQKVDVSTPVEEVSLWFDIFSCTQHNSSQQPFEWWTETFLFSMKSIGKTVMVLESWNNLLTLKRAWILWEVYLAVTAGNNFDVALGEKESAGFSVGLVKDTTNFYNMLTIINSARSEAKIISDRDKIHQAINKTLGFDGLNSLVLNAMRGWAVKSMEKVCIINNPVEILLLFYLS
jgi:hypothetical protein